MRIVFAGSHILHWRSLIPVACEVARRGHAITVERNRPNWLGMPTFQMNWRPTHVTGVNKTSLAWLSEKIGYGQEWQAAQGHIDYKPHFIPEEYDAAVSTTKDLDFLQDMGEEINGHMTCFAIGYQHFPGIIHMGRYAWTDRLLNEPPPKLLPEALTGIHPFGSAHGFGSLALNGRVTPCAFPHLDKVEISQSHKHNRVLIQHHGGYRGLRGHEWLADVVRAINAIGYEALVCPHFIPGRGYDRYAIIKALDRDGPSGNWRTANRWWDVAGQCDLILTTGSSAAYEMWAVGLTNVFILGYLGGTRHEKFQMFQDLLVESPEALAKLLRGLPGSAQATEPLTREVMEAYRSVHNGQGAKTAADVIEGKL